MARATSSLPVPDSPVTSTLRVGAICSAGGQDILDRLGVADDGLLAELLGQALAQQPVLRCSAWESFMALPTESRISSLAKGLVM